MRLIGGERMEEKKGESERPTKSKEVCEGGEEEGGEGKKEGTRQQGGSRGTEREEKKRK